MKNIQIIKNSIIIISLLFITSCSDDDNNDPQVQLPNKILVNSPQLYPEGIVYSKQQNKFYLGSLYLGKIISVDSEGNVQDFAEDDSLISIVGLAIDETTNRLIVTNSDPGLGLNTSSATAGKLLQVIVYDLDSGTKLNTYDFNETLEDGHFANDVIIDNNGNIYLTDSFSPFIYKVDADGNKSTLITNDAFSAPQGSFGLNGIIYHPDNYLIVSKYDEGKLFKIPLDNPENYTEITLNQSVNTIDGMEITNNNSIVLISNRLPGNTFVETAYQIKTNDNWLTGSIESTFTDFEGTFPTTVTSADNSIFVINSFIDVLFVGDTSIETFIIEKIPF